MSKSMKAVLLSALVFPGTGHFYLKKHFSGIILMAATLASFAVIISQALERAQKIAEKIQLGDIPLDIAAISELVSEQPTGAAANQLSVASAILIVAWLVGIVDSYRVGRGQNKGATGH